MKITLSAFADEISASFDEQLDGLKKLGIEYIELRGVDGKSFVALTDSEADDVRRKLLGSGIRVSSLGSPIGKLAPDGDFEEHMALLERVMDIGDILGDAFPVHRIRFFSFYKRDGMSEGEFEEQVFTRIERILARANERGYIMCHENEKDIYGESPERVKTLCEHFGGRLRLALDNGNFAFCKIDPSGAWNKLGKYVEYLHIKDADADGTIVPPGCGVAHLRELFDTVIAGGEGTMFATVEPHLCDFTGLTSLVREGHEEGLKHKYSFSSPFEAFETATNEIRKMIHE